MMVSLGSKVKWMTQHCKVVGPDGKVLYEGYGTIVHVESKIDESGSTIKSGGYVYTTPGNQSLTITIEEPVVPQYAMGGPITDESGLVQHVNKEKYAPKNNEEIAQVADVLEKAVDVLLRDGWTQHTLHGEKKEGK